MSRESHRKWQQENKEKVREYNRKWYQENKEKMHEANKRWRENNIDKVKEYNKKGYEKFIKTHDWVQYCAERRKARVQRLKAEGVINAWEVCTKGVEPKYKKGDKNE